MFLEEDLMKTNQPKLVTKKIFPIFFFNEQISSAIILINTELFFVLFRYTKKRKWLLITLEYTYNNVRISLHQRIYFTDGQ